MVTRHSFGKELEELHLDLIKMGSLVEESIENTILALKKQDIDLSSNYMHDLCNKDFTINAKAYNPVTGSLLSPFGDADKIKTVMDADDVISFNPYIIMRAIYLSLKHNLNIDEELDNAINKYSPLLFKKYPNSMLQFAKKKIEDLGKEEANELFEKYELNDLFDFGD